MQSVSTYLAMGGYAAFVWTAYGAVAVVLAALVVASRRGLRARQQEMAALVSASSRRRGTAGESEAP